MSGSNLLPPSAGPQPTVWGLQGGNSPAQIATARAPDLVVLNTNAAIKVVGEVKTPWPQDHVEILSLGVEQFELGMAAGFVI